MTSTSSSVHPATSTHDSTANMRVTSPITASLAAQLEAGRPAPPNVIMDLGSETIKCGWSGDDAPLCMTPALIARTTTKSSNDSKTTSSTTTCTGTSGNERFVGDDAQQRREIADIIMSHPIQNGVLNHWDDIETLWRYIYTKQLSRPVPDGAPRPATPTIGVNSQEYGA
jgi:actin-related protein